VTETTLRALDRMYAWPGPRARVSLIGARLGRLVLTSERLLFLSTGTNGIARDLGVTLTVGAPFLPILGGRATDQLDSADLENEGAVNVRLESIHDARVERRWDLSSYLVVESVLDGGKRDASSFMTRFGFNRGELLAFLEALKQQRRDRNRLAQPHTRNTLSRG